MKKISLVKTEPEKNSKAFVHSTCTVILIELRIKKIWFDCIVDPIFPQLKDGESTPLVDVPLVSMSYSGNKVSDGESELTIGTLYPPGTQPDPSKPSDKPIVQPTGELLSLISHLISLLNLDIEIFKINKSKDLPVCLSVTVSQTIKLEHDGKILYTMSPPVSPNNDMRKPSDG